MNSKRAFLGAMAAIAVVLVARLCLFTVEVTEYAVVTRLGKVREVYREDGRGLHFKWPPPIEEVTKIDARIHVLDLAAEEYLTEDKTNVTAEVFCVWRISDPLVFLKSVGTQRGAESRLGIVIGSEVGSSLGRVAFASLVSTDTELNRFDEVLAELSAATLARGKDYGVEVLDVRIKRLNFPEQNQQSVFARMKAERARIAKRFRSEGEEKALEIRAQADQEKSRLLAEAEGEASRTRGEGEAEAARIFAEALEQDPELYRFLRTLEAYRKVLDANTTIVLPSESEFMRLLVHGSAATP